MGKNSIMNISCDGKMIVFMSEGRTKKYNLENLPEKYYERYE